MRNSGRVDNFGGNVAFEPAVRATPRDEAEVWRLLAKHRGRRIRAIGRLHSWSEAAMTDEVLLDLRKLDGVRVDRRGNEIWATIGAGCQIKRALAELQRQAEATLPALGLISEQTIAGATATGTHGSGRHSTSHYLAEVRVATYDEMTGAPVIRTFTDGNELRAARCSLGCLGIVLAVRLRCRPQYRIEEHFNKYANLPEVLAAEGDYPLQQFFLLPWLWQYLAQHRREVGRPRTWDAAIYRAYWWIGMDVTLHLVIQLLAKVLTGGRATRFFYRCLVPYIVPRGWKVVDRSDRRLVMEHELFRHIEIELFVERWRLPAALEFVERVLRSLGGETAALDGATRARLAELGLLDDLLNAAGTYVHHYPICIRRVLADDTLISMASGDGEPWYAISLISYARPADRDGFQFMAQFLTASMTALFHARPHWGKVCPLTAAQAARAYPRWAAFQALCRRLDPRGVFRNRWIDRVLFGGDSQQ